MTLDYHEEIMIYHIHRKVLGKAEWRKVLEGGKPGGQEPSEEVSPEPQKK